ncbi:acyl-CoA dehydrogenase family protein [Mycolicibacterium vaccae]|uniref:acyl-CoA dehydrogenase family protein n=1 Tax=Mycolicibacterium vaccae TaxID=1810 RepID=UPI003CFBF415
MRQVTVDAHAADVAVRLSRVTPIADALRAHDADAERDRELQHDAVHGLRRAGVLSLRVPQVYGGPGGRVADVVRAVIEIGAGSSNVAQALRAHFGFCERLLSNRATEAERAEWFPKINAGMVIGNAITDAGGSVPGSSATTVLPDTDGVLRLNGHKFYSTGTLYADLIAVSAVDADGNDVQVIVPADRAGVELFDDWDGFGQRMTASGATRFTDVEIAPVEVTTVSDGAHLGHSTTFLQLYLAAVTAGIAAAVAADAVDYVRHRARPAAHSLAARAADDPFVLQAVGEISAVAASTRALVLSAADALDALVDSGAHDHGDTLAAAAVTVAQAQLVTGRLTLQAAQRLFDTGGASATARSLNLDRHWRNARTLASHNPLDYKAHAAGDYHVNGTAPPANGYF